MTNRDKLIEIFGRNVHADLMTAEWWDKEYHFSKAKEANMKFCKECPHESRRVTYTYKDAHQIEVLEPCVHTDACSRIAKLVETATKKPAAEKATVTPKAEAPKAPAKKTTTKSKSKAPKA